MRIALGQTLDDMQPGLGRYADSNRERGRRHSGKVGYAIGTTLGQAWGDVGYGIGTISRPQRGVVEGGIRIAVKRFSFPEALQAGAERGEKGRDRGAVRSCSGRRTGVEKSSKMC